MCEKGPFHYHDYTRVEKKRKCIKFYFITTLKSANRTL